MDVTTYAQILRYFGRLQASRSIPNMAADRVENALSLPVARDKKGLADVTVDGSEGEAPADEVSLRDSCEDFLERGVRSEQSGRCRRSRTPVEAAERDEVLPADTSIGSRLLDRLISDIEMVLHDVENDYTGVELQLRQDLASNKIRWYGVWSRDLWCFLRNNNPAVSLCHSHYLHPISRKNRIVAMALQVLFLLFISAALTEARLCEACGFRSCNVLNRHPEDCELSHNHSMGWRSNGPGEEALAHYEPPNEDVLLAAEYEEDPQKVQDRRRKVHNLRIDQSLNFCCLCSQLLVLWFYEAFGRQGVFLYAVGANCMFSLFVFPLMMCACVQHLSPRFRKLGEVVGYAVVALFAGVMLFWTPFLIKYVCVNQMFEEFTVNLLVSKVGSWSTVSLINVFFFSCLWWLQGGPARPSEEGRRRGHHVTAEDYVTYLLAHQRPESVAAGVGAVLSQSD